MVSALRSIIGNLFIHSFLVAFTFNSYTVGDQEFKVTSGNKTTVYVWTLGSVEDHVLHCLAHGENPLPSLKWAYGPDREEFRGNETIIVDTTNVADIKMTFKKIDYTTINEFYCLAFDPKNSTSVISEATIDILVGQDKSSWCVFWWLLFVTIFVVAAVAICRVFKINDYAVELEK